MTAPWLADRLVCPYCDARIAFDNPRCRCGFVGKIVDTRGARMVVRSGDVTAARF